MKVPKRKHWMDSHIFFKFQIVEHYLRDAGVGISLAQKKQEHYFEEQLDKYPQDAQWIIETYEGDMKKYKQTYLNMLYSSSFVTSYSVFETLCAELCALAKDRIKITLTYKSIKGKNDMDVFREYFKKVIGLNIDHLHKEWSILDDFRKTRNAIVHNRSNIWQNSTAVIEKQELYRFVTSHTSVKLNKRSGNFHFKDGAFFDEFISTATLYLRGVLKEILKLKQKRTPRKKTI
jgi:hypothetical protein